MAKEKKTPIVERKKVVTIEYTLKDEHGKVLEDKNTLTYLHGFKKRVATNTAAAAKEVALLKDPSLAAIANRETAGIYGLRILDEAINESASNTTRFVVLSAGKEPKSPAQRKIFEKKEAFSLILIVKNEAGAVARAITTIGDFGFNMRTLRSRPQKNLLWIVCGGIVCALNTFARIPNILGCSFVLVIFVGGLIKNEKRIQTIRKTLAFFMGFLTGALSVLLMMMYLGHLDLFLDSMISLNHTAISSEEVGNTTHSLQNLILVQVKFYFQLSKIVIVLAALLFFSRKLENNRYRYIIGGVVFIWMLVFSYIGVSVYDILCALCIIGCCYAIMFKPLEYKTIAALGLLMLTLQPCGSDFVHNQGAFSAVVAAPIASYSLVRKSNVHIIIPVYIVALFIIVCICHFFDRGKIWELNYMFKQKELRFIHSSNYKTRIIDETMSEISSYVIQGDTLLVYPCAPMMNYLTHTRPFKSYLYSSSLIVISGKLKDVSDSFPKVLIDKTTSTDWSEVNEFVLNDDRIDNLDNDGLMTIERFLVKHNYSRVFENSCFVLFVKK